MRSLQITLGLVTAIAVSGIAPAAGAGCCQLVRIDPPASTVLRVCEDDGTGHCGTVLFEGDLAQDASQAVCTADSTILYQEWDTTGASFDAPVVARCDGDDVEL